MEKRITYLGSVSLTSLNHETIIRNGKKGIFIPVEENPAIFFQQKEDGTKVINLDIEAKPTPNNQFGNDFMLKASVGKANRQKLGNLTREQMNQYTPILGNLRKFEFEIAGNGNANANQATQQAGGYQGPDMPEQFDGSW